MCQSIFINTVACLSLQHYWKRHSGTGNLLWTLRNLKTTFLTEHFWETASVILNYSKHNVKAPLRSSHSVNVYKIPRLNNRLNKTAYSILCLVLIWILIEYSEVWISRRPMKYPLGSSPWIFYVGVVLALSTSKKADKKFLLKMWPFFANIRSSRL